MKIPSWWKHPENQARGFRLFRYFTVAGLVAFLIVAAAVYRLERRESDFFRQVQAEQAVFVNQLHERFAREQEESARKDLLLAHELEHVNLTQLLANALWDSHLVSFRARALNIFAPCHRNASDAATVSASPGASQCRADATRRIIASREFQALDAKLAATTSKTTLFKIKIFDEQGITIYSSEHNQIGEDKRNNAGWSSAIRGRPASELTYRDKFSAFEGVVENRDLISSYVPMHDRRGSGIIGVFEIYSDVTPLLKNIRATTANIAASAAANRARLEEVAARNQHNVDAAAYAMVATTAGLLAALYVALLLIVRRAQGILDAQARVQEQAIRREERWHREKMSVLATMAATVGHEIGNPLATIAGIADDIVQRQAGGAACGCRADIILEQVHRIAAKTRQMEDFSTARGERAELTDINAVVQAVCEFLSFDRRFAGTALEFRPAAALPAREIVADHLTEAIMNLLQAHVETDDSARRPPGRIVVETVGREHGVLIRMTSDIRADSVITATNPRVESIRRRIVGLNGTLSVSNTVCEIVLSDGAPQPS